MQRSNLIVLSVVCTSWRPTRPSWSACTRSPWSPRSAPPSPRSSGSTSSVSTTESDAWPGLQPNLLLLWYDCCVLSKYVYFSTDLKLPFYLIIFVSFVVDCTKIPTFLQFKWNKNDFPILYTFSWTYLFESIFFIAETAFSFHFIRNLFPMER